MNRKMLVGGAFGGAGWGLLALLAFPLALVWGLVHLVRRSRTWRAVLLGLAVLAGLVALLEGWGLVVAAVLLAAGTVHARGRQQPGPGNVVALRGLPERPHKYGA
jgi:hypothetical protein